MKNEILFTLSLITGMFFIMMFFTSVSPESRHQVVCECEDVSSRSNIESYNFEHLVRDFHKIDIGTCLP
jgi:hypothetical protein